MGKNSTLCPVQRQDIWGDRSQLVFAPLVQALRPCQVRRAFSIVPSCTMRKNRLIRLNPPTCGKLWCYLFQPAFPMGITYFQLSQEKCSFSFSICKSAVREGTNSDGFPDKYPPACRALADHGRGRPKRRESGLKSISLAGILAVQRPYCDRPAVQHTPARRNMAPGGTPALQ